MYQVEAARSAGVMIYLPGLLLALFANCFRGQFVTRSNLSQGAVYHRGHFFVGIIVSGNILSWEAFALGGFLTGGIWSSCLCLKAFCWGFLS